MSSCVPSFSQLFTMVDFPSPLKTNNNQEPTTSQAMDKI